jgi:nucleotide-binding universal stress UspA family protein
VELGQVDGSWPGADAWLVCGVSGSPNSRAALRWALREAAERDAKVMAVRVWAGGAAAARAECERDLVATVRAAVQDTGVRGRTWVRLLDGDPDGVLAALAEEADLLVLGSHEVSHGG